ncbi:aminomethyl transferase family protein [Homoserinimonas sp. A447]
MTTQNLQAAIEKTGNPVEVLRNATSRPFTFPVTPEFTNWRSEQASWKDSCALLDQSHHMADLFVSGPDATKFFTWIGTNSASAYQVGRAKQLVAVNHDGFVIGDGILFHLGENSFDLVALPMLSDWVEYNIRTGDWDVSLERDDHSLIRKGDPKLFRYELQGPNALKIIEKVTGQPAPELKFFHMGEVEIAGGKVGVLRHGMAGQPGFELWGPWAQAATVHAALLADGAEFGITQVGAKGYSSANLGSGWVPSPPPAIFQPELKPYREWLELSKAGSLGGSFFSSDISDYYLTPYDIGLGRSVSFDHEFLGKEALQQHAENQRRTKVTLVWNDDDVTRALGSVLGDDELPAKYIELPKSRYALYQTDQVLKDGQLVGLSLDVGYLANERVFLSLATIAKEFAATGTEVTVVWGEDPVSRKAQVEPHRQVEIRATVAPAPYYDYARGGYRASSPTQP